MAWSSIIGGSEHLVDDEPVDEWAVRAWLGLAAYVFVVDVALGVTGHEYMTDAWRKALKHPVHRVLVIAAWGFTTKHLFFRNFLPKVDPFGAIAIAVEAIKGIKR